MTASMIVWFLFLFEHANVVWFQIYMYVHQIPYSPVEYIDCISVEGKETPLTSVLDMTLNCI